MTDFHPPRTSRRWAVLPVAVALLVAANTTAAAGAARLRATPPQASKPSLALVPFRDRVIHPGRRALPAQAPFGGDFTASDGSVVSVYMSPTYVPDAAILQSWADVFGSFLHGDEIDTVTVFLAPFDEMQQLCGSDEADSCYDADNEIVFLVGNTPPDGASLEELAAHEYGHHIATSRSNAPWRAGFTGPKYWATRMHVCQATDAGVMFPGDEDAHYTRNPGEGWAETYRVLNGLGTSDWPIVDDLFYPGAAELRAARRDVLEPWGGLEYTDYRGRFGPRGRWRLIPLTVQNDGRVGITLRARGGLDADLYLYARRSSRKPLQRAARSGHREHLKGTYCGYRHLWLGIYRYRGTGSYRARVSLPWTTRY